MADKPFVSPRRLKKFLTNLLGEKLNTKEEILANTDVKKFAGAMAVQEMFNDVNNSLGNVKIYVGEDGKLHFVDGTGADSVLNFSGKPDFFVQPDENSIYLYTSLNGGGTIVDLTNYSTITTEMIVGENYIGCRLQDVKTLANVTSDAKTLDVSSYSGEYVLMGRSYGAIIKCTFS